MDTRAPISHPYPPAYHSQLSTPDTTSYASSTPQPSSTPQSNIQLDYERRREQRRYNNVQQSQSQPQPQQQQYTLQQSVDTPPQGYPPSSYPPSYDTYAQNNSYTAGGVGEQSRRPPALPLDSRPSSGASGLGTELSLPLTMKGDYPDGWTKEDEEAEREFLSQGMINWQDMRNWRFWIRKEWWLYYLLGTVLVVLVCLMALFHDQIVTWLTPATTWMKDLTAGWVIPIAVLFVISFPPLFGHEIVAILVGVVWGLWVGFGIVAAGTFIGEVGNFYAFKYCCRGRAEKHEKNNLNYACLAHVVRNGGFMIIFAARLSAIPGHFTTAVFATCGMNIWIFMIAAILTLPKQLITVYLGVIFEESTTGSSTKNRIISDSVLAVGFLITIGAAYYIYREMNKARVVVWRKQRMQLAARGVKLHSLNAESGLAEDDADVDVDANSPMLVVHERAQRRASYVNPYDIRYNRTEDMSVYHVDTINQPLEEDIGHHFQSTQQQAAQPSQRFVNARQTQAQVQAQVQAYDQQPYPSSHPSQQQYPPSQSHQRYPSSQSQSYAQASQPARPPRPMSPISQAPTYTSQSPPQPVGFPQAHPQTSNIRRDPSASYYGGQGDQVQQLSSTTADFPVPSPARPESIGSPCGYGPPSLDAGVAAGHQLYQQQQQPLSPQYDFSAPRPSPHAPSDPNYAGYGR